MKEYTFPQSRLQKDFEDLAKSIIRLMSEMQAHQMIDLHEYAMRLWDERFDDVQRTWDNR